MGKGNGGDKVNFSIRSIVHFLFSGSLMGQVLCIPRSRTICQIPFGKLQGIHFMRSLILFLLIPFSTAHSQGLDTLKGVSNLNGNQLPYTVLSTKVVDPASVTGIPVILFLHGAGERGADNKAQLTVGLPQLIKSLDSLKINPYIIVAPQCAADIKWVDTDWTLPSHTMKPQLSPVLANAKAVFDSVVAHTPLVDTNCLYLTGLSMGGFGAWELAQRFPDRFAAVLPICGGGDTAQAAKLTQVPIWAFHGKKDKLVKVSRTTDMISAISKHGGKPNMTLYDTIGHLCWNTVYKDLDVIRWLFSNRRNEG